MLLDFGLRGLLTGFEFRPFSPASSLHCLGSHVSCIPAVKCLLERGWDVQTFWSRFIVSYSFSSLFFTFFFVFIVFLSSSFYSSSSSCHPQIWLNLFRIFSHILNNFLTPLYSLLLIVKVKKHVLRTPHSVSVGNSFFVFYKKLLTKCGPLISIFRNSQEISEINFVFLL
jgi:hypothetical protein